MMEHLRSRLALLAVLVVATTSALAQGRDCPAGRPDKLELIVWSAEPGRNGLTITFTVRSTLSKATRSISATLILTNSQGAKLADLPLNPDLRIRPGTTGTL